MKFVVTVERNEQELEKHARQAKKSGRSVTSFKDAVENAISNALKYDWRVSDFKIEVLDEPPA